MPRSVAHVQSSEGVELHPVDKLPACPFCVLDDPAVTVYSDGILQALVSRAPINRYHVIIIPRDHVERLPDLSTGIAAAVVSTAQRISRAIVAAIAPDGITYLTEDDLTGQGYNLVAHWKLHIIPRFKDEAVRIDWARTPDPCPSERAQIADDIRGHLSPDSP